MENKIETVSNQDLEGDDGLDMAQETLPRKKVETPKVNEEASSFSPLQEPRMDREYAKGNETPRNENTPIDIPEPDFTPETPTSDELFPETPFTEVKNESSGSSSKKNTPKEEYNPSMESMSNKEKKEAAEMMAEQVVDIYLEYKPKLFRYVGKVPRRKIEKMVLDGKLDMSTKMDFGDGICTLKEKIDELNDGIEQSFQTSPEFKEKVMPALTRVFMKKDIGLTDEQFLMLEFGKDFVGSIVELVQIKQYMKQILNAATDAKLQYDLHEQEFKKKYNVNDNDNNKEEPRNTPPPQSDINVKPQEQPPFNNTKKAETEIKNEEKKSEPKVEYEVEYTEIKTSEVQEAVVVSEEKIEKKEIDLSNSNIADEGDTRRSNS